MRDAIRRQTFLRAVELIRAEADAIEADAPRPEAESALRAGESALRAGESALRAGVSALRAGEAPPPRAQTSPLLRINVGFVVVSPDTVLCLVVLDQRVSTCIGQVRFQLEVRGVEMYGRIIAARCVKSSLENVYTVCFPLHCVKMQKQSDSGSLMGKSLLYPGNNRSTSGGFVD